MHTRTKLSLAVLLGGLLLAGLAWRLPLTAAEAGPDATAAAVAAARARLDVDGPGLIPASFRDVVQAVAPAVVNINTTARIQARGPALPFFHDPWSDLFGDDFFEDFFRRQMPPRTYEQRALGTGVVVSEEGYVLTNNHVVARADEIQVTLEDGRRFEAKVVGTDAATDLAVLKIEADDLVAARLGDSDRLEVGDWVVAVGNPFGLDHTVTAGIVSAKGRAGVGVARFEDFIQTDAAINPGNSGGPLLDLQGRVVGINTAIATRTGSYAGIGFAIPINMARRVMESLIETGEVERGWLGVYIQDLTPDLARSFGFDGTEGVVVSQVVKDGPAAEAGLIEGDIILEVKGRKVRDGRELLAAVAALAPGSTVELEVFRDGSRQGMTVTLGVRPAEEGRAAGEGGPSTIRDLGLQLRTLTPELAQRHDLHLSEGVLVTGVAPGSLAQAAGIRPGDVIVSVNGRRVESVDDLREAMGREGLRQGVRLLLDSQGRRHFVFLRQG